MSKVEVVIRDETSSKQISAGSMSLTPLQAVNSVSPKTIEVQQNKASQKSLAIASMVAQQSFSYITSNVGRYTGNVHNQTTVDNIMQMASIGAMAYISPGLAMATIGVNIASAAISNLEDQKWDKKQSEISMARAGYNSVGEIIGRRH